MDQHIVIHWLRRDLRIDDNLSLQAALESGHPVLCVYFFDREECKNSANSLSAQISFIYQRLRSLKSELRAFGTDLLVLYGEVPLIWQEVLRSFQVCAIYTGKDYEPRSLLRDRELEIFLRQQNIDFRLVKDHVIFESSEVLKQDGKPYTVFTPYYKNWRIHYESVRKKPGSLKSLFRNFLKIESPFSFPDIRELGLHPSTLPFPPMRLERAVLRNYEKMRDFPALENGTTRLGVHLRFGSISIRQLAEMAAQESEVFLSELAWRDFFMAILHKNPELVENPFRREFLAFPWRNDAKDFDHWKTGTTGYPFVDAGMRELNATGYMHNRVRMVVASFLTKHLLIDWRWGERYFAEKLLDFELSSNNGNWQWAAGTGCDAAPYFRIFNPTRQQERFDPDFRYTRKWVPEFESGDYPPPIVNHGLARNRALEMYNRIRHK